MAVLVTGFTPFGPHRSNCSESLVRALKEAPTLTTQVVPTSYLRAADEIIRALNQQTYDAVILFGLAANQNALRLEQVALNLDDSAVPDNDGQVRARGPIDSQAPVAYRSTLPLAAMAQIAETAGEPVGWSRDAGGYVCNHTFFRVAQVSQALLTPCGFVHLPALAPNSPRLRQIASIVESWGALLSAPTKA